MNATISAHRIRIAGLQKLDALEMSERFPEGGREMHRQYDPRPQDLEGSVAAEKHSVFSVVTDPFVHFTSA